MPDRSRYHHGALRDALIDAGEALARSRQVPGRLAQELRDAARQRVGQAGDIGDGCPLHQLGGNPERPRHCGATRSYWL